MRWGKPTKNKKRSDPRYFLNEDVLTEGHRAAELTVTSGTLSGDQADYLRRSFSGTRVTPQSGQTVSYEITSQAATGPDPGGSLSDSDHYKILSVHKRLVAFKKIPEGVSFRITFSN